MVVIVKKAKILFVCLYFSSFIQKDLDLLKKHFDLNGVDFVLNKESPCLSPSTCSITLMESIEWIENVEGGWDAVVGADNEQRIVNALQKNFSRRHS